MSLPWIRGTGSCKELVENRVRKIIYKKLTWKYVSTKELTVDLGTRGVDTGLLKEHWLRGPSWLYTQGAGQQIY